MYKGLVFSGYSGPGFHTQRSCDGHLSTGAFMQGAVHGKFRILFTLHQAPSFRRPPSVEVVRQ